MSSPDGFDYPIVSFERKWQPENTPNGTIARNAIFYVGHFGFFMFNFLNIFVILLLHGYVFRRLKGNFLIQLALPACFGQMCSCLSSMHRYNINAEYGYYSQTSIAYSLVGYTFLNWIVVHIFLNQHAKFVRIGYIVWVVIGVLDWFGSVRTFEEDDFDFLRYYITLSTFHQLFAYIACLWALEKGKVTVLESSPFSNDIAKRALHIGIVLVLVSLALAASARPPLQFPATGLTFTVVILVATIVGETDFMQKAPAKESADADMPANESTSLV